MRTIATIVAGAALALTAATAVSAETRLERGEAKLAEMIEGRTAGEPVSCITTFRSNGLRVIENVGLVYEAGDTVYVSRPINPDSLGAFDVPVIERRGGQLCSSDQIRTVDRSGGFVTGVVFLTDFVPYRKG